MPDPTMTAALKEAYATALNEEILPALELAHSAFTDLQGNPDSIWLTPWSDDFEGTLEDDAPMRPAQTVTWRHFPFRFRLAPVDTSPAPDVEIRIDGVDRRIIEALDAAVVMPTKILLRYREYLASDLSAPSIVTPRTFVLNDVKVGALSVMARARIDADLNGAFPRFVYTAQEFPALIGA